jgi:hypothetical protein
MEGNPVSCVEIFSVLLAAGSDVPDPSVLSPFQIWMSGIRQNLVVLVLVP